MSQNDKNNRKDEKEKKKIDILFFVGIRFSAFGIMLYAMDFSKIVTALSILLMISGIFMMIVSKFKDK